MTRVKFVRLEQICVICIPPVLEVNRREKTIELKTSNMKQFNVNGILVNAISFNKKGIVIDFKEAKRLLTTYQLLSFIICDPTSDEVLSVVNFECFKSEVDAKFLIVSKKTEGIQDARNLECDLYDVGFDCISSIKAHLIRLGGFIDYNISEVSASVGYNQAKDVSSMLLNDEGEIVVARSYGRDEDLESLLCNNNIKVDDLLSILKGLENIVLLKYEIE